MVSPLPQSQPAMWKGPALRDLGRLAHSLQIRMALDEPLSRHTSMGVGGPCPSMLWPRHPGQVRRLAEWIGQRQLPYRVLGGGSNLLVDDAGVDAVVINTTSLDDGNTLGPEHARFAAGVPMARALRLTAERGLDGLVWAAGLPGTIGGAAAGNAGCWGGDMEHAVAEIDLVDGHGVSHRLSSSRLRWGYRNLELADPVPGVWVIVGVSVRCNPGDPEQLRRRYVQLQDRKRDRQPVGARNSGCIFRNPPGKQSAGQLLDAAGCKGMRLGGAEVSSIHANFIINRGDANAAEVWELTRRMQRRVQERFGVMLQPEIRRW